MDQVVHRGCRKYGLLSQLVSNHQVMVHSGQRILLVMKERLVLPIRRGMGLNCQDILIVLIKHRRGNSIKLLSQSTTDMNLVVGDAIQVGGIATIYKVILR